MEISLKCRCGKVRGTGNPAGTPGRFVCLCDDCQTFGHFLGNAKSLLDANGGSEVVPMRPANVKITAGKEYVKCVRLSPQGMYRWFAECCRTPISNTMRSPRVPFASIHRHFLDFDAAKMDATFGPIRARVMGKFGIAPLPPRTYAKAPLGAILSHLRFLGVGFVTGAAQPSPFFQPDGEPTAAAQVLTLSERQALRQFCGPHPAV